MAAYAVLNADDVCINRVSWDGVARWSPPPGCRAVLDDQNRYPIYREPEPEPEPEPEVIIVAEEPVDGSESIF